MIQVKTFNNILDYTHSLIDTEVNKWLKENSNRIHVIDIKYNVTSDSYESVLVIYEILEELKA